MTTLWQVFVVTLATATVACFAMGEDFMEMDRPLPGPDCGPVPAPKGNNMFVSAVVVFLLGGQFALYHKSGLLVFL
jgi:hypothetical protein